MGKSRKEKKAKDNTSRSDKRSKLSEKIDMYDMILANIISGRAIIEPEEKLDNKQLDIGFSNISSDSRITKYYLLRKFPDYMPRRLIDLIRDQCMRAGVRINFYFYAKPHVIQWNSAEMQNRMAIWKRYSENTQDTLTTFDYRERRDAVQAKRRILRSTNFLNVSELEYKRSLLSVCFIVEVSAVRDDDSILNMSESIEKLFSTCSRYGIEIKELRVNMLDWVRAISPFSLKPNKNVSSKLSRKIVTDDILANMNSYSQGRIGSTGVPLGIDIKSGGPVLRKFKEDPNSADNWLIAAETGGGKSFFIKVLLSFLLADGFVEVIMDYEGDEYTNFGNYIKAGNPEDVKIVSMGKGDTVYFDPCEIPPLTGDASVDYELKELSVGFITSIFRVIVCGTDRTFDKWEESIISTAIQRMYDAAGVTDDKETWKRSKSLRLHDVFHEIEEIVTSKEFVDSESDNIKHKAAVSILESCKVYFKEGEAKSGTFKNPMPAKDLYKAKLIIFSFGMKGMGDSITDPTLLALKQLCVSYINIQISNYCKYVRHCYNIKVWEEFQRWGNAKGSAETILNAITGGRKRGDINFIITNNLAAILDKSNVLTQGIKPNIQNYAIGRIPSKSVREDFCTEYELTDCADELGRIAKAYSNKSRSNGKSGNSSQDRYKYAFCVILDNGSKAVCKARVPASVAKSKLYQS